MNRTRTICVLVGLVSLLGAFASSAMAQASRTTFLTLLTLDVRANRPNFPTFVDLDFYNSSEQLLSTSTEFICWQEVSLSGVNEGIAGIPLSAPPGAFPINTTLTGTNMGTRKGIVIGGPAEKVPIFGIPDTAGPVTLLGLVEVFEGAVTGVERQYFYQPYNDGTPLPSSSISQEPGSVLVLPKFITGTVTVDGTVTPRTEFEIGVVCPRGQLCPDGQQVRIRFQYICGQTNPFASSVCAVTDFALTTTVNGKLVFNPQGIGGLQGNAITPVPQCARGYMIATVIDTFGRPIKFDGLIGVAVLRESATAVSAYRAIPIQADPALATSAVINLGPGGSPAYDGAAGHYQAVSSVIIADVAFDRPFSTGSPVGSDYSLVSSGAISVVRGNSGVATITVPLQTGTTQAVSLAASGLPSGATASFNPGTCSPTCTSTLTIATAGSTPTGTFPITVTGSPLGRTTTFSLTVTAAAGGPSGPSLSVSPTSIAAGGIVTVTWSGIASPDAANWIALFPAGAADNAYLAWIFVSCSHTPGSAMAAGSCAFEIPSTLAGGTYDFRLFATNYLSKLATSNALTVP